MRVKASPKAVQLVQERGGKLYVWAKKTRCCGGSVIFLETSSEAGERPFRRVPADEIELYLDERMREPAELELDVGGLRRKRLRRLTGSAASRSAPLLARARRCRSSAKTHRPATAGFSP
jgi:hypothetical protein